MVFLHVFLFGREAGFGGVPWVSGLFMSIPKLRLWRGQQAVQQKQKKRGRAKKGAGVGQKMASNYR